MLISRRESDWLAWVMCLFWGWGLIVIGNFTRTIENERRKNGMLSKKGRRDSEQ